MNNDNMVFILLLMMTASTVLLGCGGSKSDEGANTSQAQQERAVNVAVQEIRPMPFAETIRLTGSIKAIDDILVSPEEGGVVKEWKYQKGQFVAKDSVIVVLKDEVARPSYEAALAQYKISELNYEKQVDVYSEKAVSEMQLKTSQYSRDAAKANADLMRARWERTHLKAPVSGILDDRIIDEGEMAAPGVPIARIVNITVVKVVINVPELYAGSITLGTPVTLTVAAFPSETFNGKINFIGAALSADNRTFPVELVVRNPHLKLKPEMIAKVHIVQSVPRNALLLEEGIVQQVDRNKLVVYVENGGKAQEHVVRIGGRNENVVEIVSGLKAGDRVITRGFQNLVDGQPIVVRQ